MIRRRRNDEDGGGKWETEKRYAEINEGLGRGRRRRGNLPLTLTHIFKIKYFPQKVLTDEQ